MRAVALHVADDVAYGAGVWVGCARERTLVPLIPRVAWRSRVWSSPALRELVATSESIATAASAETVGRPTRRPAAASPG